MTAPDCPDPAGCSVPAPTSVDVGQLRVAALPEGAKVCRSFLLARGYDAFNPGFGDTRFAPVVASTGASVATAYGAADDVGALLETVLHDVHHVVGDRVVYEAIVRRWGLAFVTLPVAMAVVDLRNAALARLGLGRENLVTTTAEHYPCTREWAVWLHEQQIDETEAVGMLWHSRQAELHTAGSEREVFVLWGDRVPSDPGSYPLTGPGVRNLTEGPGRVLLDELAEDLDARIEPA